jgi:hypothetical protein
MLTGVQQGPIVLGIFKTISPKMLPRVQLGPRVLGIYLYERTGGDPSGSIRPRTVRGFMDQTDPNLFPRVQLGPSVLGILNIISPKMLLEFNWDQIC